MYTQSCLLLNVPLNSRYANVSLPYHSTAMSGLCFHMMLVMRLDMEPGDTILIIADGSSIYDLINMTLYFAVFIG